LTSATSGGVSTPHFLNISRLKCRKVGFVSQGKQSSLPPMVADSRKGGSTSAMNSGVSSPSSGSTNSPAA